jgi:hypothetical protein
VPFVVLSAGSDVGKNVTCLVEEGKQKGSPSVVWNVLVMISHDPPGFGNPVRRGGLVEPDDLVVVDRGQRRRLATEDSAEDGLPRLEELARDNWFVSVSDGRIVVCTSPRIGQVLERARKPMKGDVCITIHSSLLLQSDRRPPVSGVCQLPGR